MTDDLSRRLAIDGAQSRRFRIALTLVSAEAGGRTTPLRSGYRADWALNGLDGNGSPRMLNGAPVVVDVEWLHPGDSASVVAHPVAPEYWGDVVVGQDVSMHEGRRMVGTGTVTDIVEPSRP